MFTRDRLQYMVGGLLYMPALQDNIVSKIREKRIPCMTSVALCLEDSVQDSALHEAEKQLNNILIKLRPVYEELENRPLLFIRVRTPEHMKYLYDYLGENAYFVTGFILPKFDLSNCNQYVDVVEQINASRTKSLYVMPVLETMMLADINVRVSVLGKIKEILNGIKDHVLNIRVGGNDFSNLYALRRSVNTSIYSVGVIRDILVDIVNIFAQDYVVSGPVWEYFDDGKNDMWAKGLVNELEQDKINGFIGKTAIHPSQLPYIFNSMKVIRSDYDDARNILQWDVEQLGVKKSSDGTRMNEVKTHTRWATRIKALGDIYGIKD